MAKNHKSDYDKLADAIMHSGDRQREQDDKYMAALGDPDIFIPDEDLLNPEDKSGWGYWRMSTGVLAIHRGGKGTWNLRGYTLYKEDWINRMRALITCPPHPDPKVE